LAYLDDTLEPAQAKLIGQKVAESDAAQELIARIKQVMRRRRLTTPPNTGPGTKVDANSIAEYLDNVLSTEQLAEVEQTCLASDVHLAEIAACHQILTLVLGEPVLVPPTARQRMYGLVKGPEAIPFRKAHIGAFAEEPLHESAETDETLRLGLPALRSKNVWSHGLALLSGGVIVAALLAVAIIMLFQQTPSPQVSQLRDRGKPPEKAVLPVETDGSKDKNIKPKDESGDSKKDGKKDGKPDSKPPGPDNGGAKPPVGDKAVIVPIEAPLAERKPVGKYISEPDRPAVLLQENPTKKEWKRLNLASREVLSGSRLVSLPGYRSKVDLDTGVRLTLWGTLPELYEYNSEWLPVKVSEKETKKLRVPFLMNVLESIVTLHQPPKGLDVDLTLHHGRLLLANQKAKGPARVRVRVNDPSVPRKADKPWEPEYQAVWDISLDDPGSELSLELIGYFDPRYDYKPLDSKEHWPPVALLKVLALKGQSHVRYREVDYPFHAPPGQALMEWSSGAGLKLEDAPGGMTPVRSDSPRQVTDLPEWYEAGLKGVYPALPKDMPKQQSDLLQKMRLLARKALDGLNRIGSNPELVLSETLAATDGTGGGKEPSPEKMLPQFLALRCFAALDDLSRLLSSLTDPENRALRQTAHMILRNHWLAREPDHELRFLKACEKRFGSRKQAADILELMHDLSLKERFSPDRREALIDGLKDNNLAIRELCAYTLYSLFPAGASIGYDPAGDSNQQDLAHQAWSKLNKDGKLIPRGAEKASK
jgi:hypothetical protein